MCPRGHLPVFVFGRAVVGFATAGIISGAFAIIIRITPLRKRPTYAGIGAATEAVAALTAPLIGGILTDRLSWRWCFFIELLLVVSALAIVFFCFDSSKEKKSIMPRAKEVPRQLDLAGTLLFVPAFAALILALQWGELNTTGQTGVFWFPWVLSFC
ncbi:MFS general substrate transporter [Fusarium albosuccineum]|uniref:MFS general substrate transporter n=1 Tax=Fusarium albosuccineum TaxID=1237068 RepID=A0A8H4LGH5_9HYPO|nr:MFS general substrate transporter [Fusarium albosuccineum]